MTDVKGASNEVIQSETVNDRALVDFIAARDLYQEKRFDQARALMQSYCEGIDYRQFEQVDNRHQAQPQISVIVVSYKTGPALLDCLNSVFDQTGLSFEVILIDNGGNRDIHPQLQKLPLLRITAPINFFPSEGRNIGAFFASAELLIFLDDDALMAPGYIVEAYQAMLDDERLGLRGRVLPKTAATESAQPGHYDLGEMPLPSMFNLEGNQVIRKGIFNEVGGFDALMFGHEGIELSRRCRARFPSLSISYWPALMIQHDFAQNQRLAAKRARQSLADHYLRFLKEQKLSAGVSILIRAGNDLQAAENFLDSLVAHNSHKSIEVILITHDPRQAMFMVRLYLAYMLVRVLPAGGLMLRRVVEKIRYEQVLLVDVPSVLQADVIADWVKDQKTDLSTVQLCQRTQLVHQVEATEDVSLAQLGAKLR